MPGPIVRAFRQPLSVPIRHGEEEAAMLTEWCCCCCCCCGDVIVMSKCDKTAAKSAVSVVM